MPESIFIQVGQCGNQVGTRFWAWAFEEAKVINTLPRRAPSLSSSVLDSFFSTSARHYSFSSDNGALKARAVLIDMEEGVINSILREKKYCELFDPRLLVTDVSGSGNNWACGFYEYGKSHGNRIKNAIRLAVEDCDSLESFFILHSMGGGTGSGLGSYVMAFCAEEYPDVLRFAFPIYPSEDDDVVTSPYNAVLSTRYLTDNATCVFPQSNQSLFSVIQRNKITQPLTKDAVLSASSAKAASQRRPPSAKPSKPFDLMNDIIAQLVLNITACARFEGPLNLDLGDVATNMVPFPRLMYLLSSQAPVAGASGPFSIKVEPLFEEAFSARNQLFGTPEMLSTGFHLANALLCRGAAIEASDIRTAVARLSRKNRLVPWNPDAWKTGLCSVGPLTSAAPAVVVALSNSTAIVKSFGEMRNRFQSLYAHRAYVHHYERVGMDANEITEAVESLDALTADYLSAEHFDESSCMRARIL